MVGKMILYDNPHILQSPLRTHLLIIQDVKQLFTTASIRPGCRQNYDFHSQIR